jgi:orotate phosphoribosyltransferase
VPLSAPDTAGAAAAGDDATSAAFIALVAGRTGHFRLESGYHARRWLDLDALFAEPPRIMPFVDALARQLRAHDAAVVCGPLLGGAFLAQLVAHALGVEFCFTEREAPPPGDALFGARYRLPPAFRRRVPGRRVAMVDDVMSAGSALRGTYETLRRFGAEPVAAGALLVLGRAGADHFAGLGVPVEAVARDEFELWRPDACPLCAAGEALEDPGGAGA